MWTYILRRLLLMIPTLFGVTVVSFVVMQLAPGDPLLERFKSSGTAGASTQTREAYVVQKRDLKLDRPLLLNFRYFANYRPQLEIAAHYRSLTTDQIEAELEQMALHPDDPVLAARHNFLRTLRIDRRERIDHFDERLDPPQLTAEQLAESNLTAEQWEEQRREKRRSLALAVEAFVMIWCENLGVHGVPPLMEMLEDPAADERQRIGMIRAMQPMVVSPFQYTFTREGGEEELERVDSTWRILWAKAEKRYETVDPERTEFVKKTVAALAAEGSRTKVFEYLENIEGDFEKFLPEDAPVFAAILLGEGLLEEKQIAAEALRLFVSDRVDTDVSLQATSEEINKVAANWRVYYESHAAEFQFSPWQRTWAVVADTQYAHMVWRLVTFNFGRSALKTRDPVSKKLWDAAMVSIPLMLLAELVIYLLSLPVGVYCAVNRGNLIDRLLQLVLYLLYSVPPFVAGMLFLMLFCYGGVFKWFPMERLHSPDAENYSTAQYVLDYLWHATLPVICLSLFSLASLAMYSRSSMLDVLGQDYIRTARAKGLSNFMVIMKHGFRNSLITVITLFASFIPALLGGSVLIEYLFDIPGMGRLGLNSIEQKDIPTLMALTYVDAIVVMLSILLSDLMYVFADPRISFESHEKTA